MNIIADFKRYIAPDFSVMDTSWLSRMVSKAARERAKHLEMMAAAFIKETKIPIKHVELVEQHTAKGIVYFYRDKRSAGN